MEYLSTKEYAKATGLSERTIRNYCVQGKLEGAVFGGEDLEHTFRHTASRQEKCQKEIVATAARTKRAA